MPPHPFARESAQQQAGPAPASNNGEAPPFSGPNPFQNPGGPQVPQADPRMIMFAELLLQGIYGALNAPVVVTRLDEKNKAVKEQTTQAQLMAEQCDLLQDLAGEIAGFRDDIQDCTKELRRSNKINAKLNEEEEDEEEDDDEDEEEEEEEERPRRRAH